MTVVLEPDPNAQVGAYWGEGCTEQVNDTPPLKPPVEFTLTVPVADCPALTVLADNAEAVKEKSGNTAVLNVAVTNWSEFITRVQEPVPEQAPPQPAKLEPPFGFSPSVT